MMQLLRNTQFRYKLILCFLLIIAINAISGLFSYRSMEEIGDLVYLTYDKALMSGSFSQAVKFDYAQFDTDIKSALLAESLEDYERFVSKSKKSYATLQEDMAVVEERALSEKMNVLIKDIEEELTDNQKTKEEFLQKKRDLFAQKDHDLEKALILRRSWDSNKVKRTIYRKLTGISDEAASVGYTFRLSSEEKTKNSLKQVIWILTISIFLSIGLGVLISFVVISPLFKLEKVTKQFATGDYSVRAAIESKDEIGNMASSFNVMLDIIQEKTDNITSLLSSLPFGLFYFDKEGKISKERSEATDKLFADFSQYTTLVDFFEAHNSNTRQISSILKATFSGSMPFKSAVGLFPKKIVIGEGESAKTVELSFKPQFNSLNKVERVILLAEDITEKLKVLEKSRELTERVFRVSKASADLESFKEFIPAVDKLYSAIVSNFGSFDPANEVNIKRDLHTLKGLLGIYGFNTCGDQIHKLESFINEKSMGENLDKCLELIMIGQQTFKAQSDDIVELLAINRSSDLKLFSIVKINAIKELAKKEHIPELIQATDALDKFPIGKVFKKYAAYADSVMERFQDKKIRVLFDPYSDEITYEEAQQIDSALIHILRNSIDHGIEDKNERLTQRKSEVGEIKISCLRLEDKSLEIKIADDGKGINGDLLAKKAVERGIWKEDDFAHASYEDKLQLIFKSGFSTKDQATEISGRGVGMDAVKDLIESLGGAIKLSTEMGIGTTFAFNIPAFEEKKLAN